VDGEGLDAPEDAWVIKRIVASDRQSEIASVSVYTKKEGESQIGQVSRVKKCVSRTSTSVAMAGSARMGGEIVDKTG
jgi:hypothetical protein